MRLNRLVVKNFRNYKDADISFGMSTNLIYGKNAQGKTNILEAISLLSTGRSFRTSSLTDAIFHGETFFYLAAFFEKEGVDQTLSLTYDGKNKQIYHNQTSHQSFLPLLGIMPSVFIVPENISLIIGAPSERRKFLDMHIAQIDPVYVYYLGRYYKAMKQRNVLLKQSNSAGLAPWEHIMAQSATYITMQRISHITKLQSIASKCMQVLSSGSDDLILTYKCHWDQSMPSATVEESFRQKFLDARKKELILGCTLYGPHKDDIDIHIGSKGAKFFGSEGQKRCVVNSLMLAQREVMKDHTQSIPLLGIDDFGAHFDKERNEMLIQLIQSDGQSFLTSPFSLEKWGHAEQREYFVQQGSIISKNILSV